MAVLVEAISVVIRADALLPAFDDDWEAFQRTVPNSTLCADGELVRVGFMAPDDAEGYVKQMERRGLVYSEGGAAKHLVVVEQQRGPLVRCDWVEFGHIDLDGDPKRRVAACRLTGSKVTRVVTPDGWTFEESLSATFGFVPTGQVEKSLTFLRHERGMDIYRNELTGKEVYIGRSRAAEDR